MALIKVQSEGVNLSDTFAFTGTVTGAGLTSPFANTVAVTSEGGAATTNVVQGLAKAWVRINGIGTAAIDDSLNCGSLTDNGTGNYSVARVNNMSSVDTYYVIEGQYINSQNTNGTDWSGTTTATVQYKVFDSSAADRDPVGYLLVGDLA